MMIKSLIIIFFLASARAKRISEIKCQEYKKMLEIVTCSGMDMFTDECINRSVTYECFNIDNTGLIIGGEEAKPGEFPHMAAIGWEDEEGNLAFRCGGSLISERFVLTAAHCKMDEEFGAPSFVRLGVQDLSVGGPAQVDRKIKNFLVRRDYRKMGQLHDIGLIEFDKPVEFNRKLLRPACLQQFNYMRDRITATGWGLDKNYGETTDKLMKVSLPIADIGVCKEIHGDNRLKRDRLICAGGEKGKDTCQGDSGGPIQYAHRDAPCVYNIIGLTSLGPPLCGVANQTSIYTKVFFYLDWIESKVWPQRL